MDYKPKGGLSTDLMLTHDPIIAKRHILTETLMLEFGNPCYQQLGKYCLHAMIHVYAFSFNQQVAMQHYAPPFVPYWMGSAVLDPVYSLPLESALGVRFTTDEIPRSILGFNAIIGSGHNHHGGYNEDPETKELKYLWADMNKYGYCYSPTRNPQYMMRVISFYRSTVV